MKCAWQALINILPTWLAREVDRFRNREMQEIRLRLDKPPELVCAGGIHWLDRKIVGEDLVFCINIASRYSPWAAKSMASGYLTAQGGHRIGICGEAIVKEGEMTGIKNITSLCIRVARDYPGIGKLAAQNSGSILIIGAPGCGKTTLLRDMIREISQKEQIAVVDERGELFPACAGFDMGKQMDVLSGCPKQEGIEILLRTMGPSCIAVDEITGAGDCGALYQAGWCGVRLLATAHASSVKELKSRPLYRPLIEQGLFDHVIILRRDKSWHAERMD